MKYHFKIHKTKSGFWAECIEADGWATQAETREGLEANMREVLEGVLSEPSDSKWIPPLPDPTIKGRNIVEVSVDPKVALATLVRISRLNRGLSQRQAAERMGFRHVIQYQRLEQARTLNPELDTLLKLKRLFPEFSLDEALA